MFAWSLTFLFGVIGAIGGRYIASGAGKNNEPLWMLGFGIGFALVGAVIGGSMDIVRVIKDRTSKPKQNPALE